MRYAIAAVALACIVGVGIFLDGRLGTPATGGAADWHRREQRFLAAALDRVQQDIARQPGAGSATATLYRERDEILQAIAAIGGQAILQHAPMTEKLAPVETERSPARPDESTTAQMAVSRPAELRPGRGLFRPAPADLADLTLDQDLRTPVFHRTGSRRQPAGKRKDEHHAAASGQKPASEASRQ